MSRTKDSLINLTSHGLNLAWRILGLTKMIFFTSDWSEHLKIRKTHKISKFHFSVFSDVWFKLTSSKIME